MNTTKATKEQATVKVACDVSFQVGTQNYGTINVPRGTKVFRHKVNGQVSDWFLEHADMVKLCPNSYKLNGVPSTFYLHDATHYGITVPNANVTMEGTPQATHKAIHF